MTAALWVGTPSVATFEAMLGWLRLHGRFMFAEQFFLPIFFDGSPRLPPYYSCQFPAIIGSEPTREQAEQAIQGGRCRTINACSAGGSEVQIGAM